MKNNKYLKKFYDLKRYCQLLILIIFIIFISKTYKNQNLINDLKNVINNHSYYKHFSHYFLNLTYINYSFSFKFKIVKVEYRIGFYNDNDDLIHPSDLTLYNKLHIVCHYNESNNHIYSLANIYNNKYFKCLEFFSLHQKVKFGINILKHHNIYNSKKNFFFLTKI